MALPVALPRLPLEELSNPTLDEAAFLADSESHPAKASVRFYNTFEGAECTWRQLEGEATGAVYQRYDWCKTWFDVFGPVLDARPLIIMVFLGTKPVMLLPLYTVATLFKRRTAQFMGDRHANIRLPLTTADPDMRLQLSQRVEAGTVMEKICQGLKRNGLTDYLSLGGMPDSFAGVDNILASQSTAACADGVYLGTLRPDFDILCRERRGGIHMKKLRKKLRILGEHGEMEFEKAQTSQSAERALETFFEQKSVRLDTIKIDNAFGDDKNCDFLRAIARKSVADQSGLLEFYTLKLDGSIVAVFGGGRFGDSFSGAVNSMTLDEPVVRKSPGEIVLHFLIERLCADGITSFDLGLGDADYKQGWCDRAQLREITYPITQAGKLVQIVESVEVFLRTTILSHPITGKIARRAKFYLKRLISKT